MSAETQAVGQKVACGNKGLSGPTRSHPAAQYLRPKPSSEEALLELRTEGAKRDMMLLVTHMLAFGECQRLCGLPEGDMRHPETPQRCYMAVSLAGAWLVAHSKATSSEYHEEVGGEFGHIFGPEPISQVSSPAPQNKTHLCVEMGPRASSRLTAGQPGARNSLSVWQHLSPCAGAPTISIFLKPPGVIPPGGSTTICCSCQGDNGNFVLYKKGHQLRSLELRGSRAEFSISNATHEDTGPYSCHYVNGDTVLARSETVDVMVQGEGCAVTPLRGVRCHMGRPECT